MKFVAVSHFPPLPGGSARSCALLFRGIASRGHQVALLGPITAETAIYDKEVSNPETLSVSRYELPHFSISQYVLNEFLRFQQIEHDQIRKILPALIDRVKPQFVRITGAGVSESHVHDVTITKEAPNYRLS